MKLLLDSQLPPALARHVNDLGTICIHVCNVGMDSATDLSIWEYAATHDMVIASKDKDFLNLAKAKGMPPQVLWIRLGNCRRIDLISAFDRRWTTIQQMLAAGMPIVELR